MAAESLHGLSGTSVCYIRRGFSGGPDSTVPDGSAYLLSYQPVLPLFISHSHSSSKTTI
ncbi:hypothetical protein HMPREF9137_0426 [Prevotella denticola F0289]|nr:hypothetical protein HMPREF9137_0426 [Prevotella denticola F0289]